MNEAALDRFADVVQRDDDDIALDVAALLIGAWEREREALDVASYQRRLDDIAARAAISIAATQSAASPWPAARALAATLFGDLGFRGNTAEYYDPRNSFLADVLERRVGIPITLSVVYLEVARRLGLPAAGVSFPGHFLVRVDGGPSPLFIDAYNGGAELGRADLAELLAHAAGPDRELDDTLLAAAPKRVILVRMLTNLAGIYARGGDLLRSVEVIERQCLLDPADARLAAARDALRRRLSSLN